MLTYQRKVNFYETDLMEIVHHSNYVRFFEEARCYWCEATGVDAWHGRRKRFLLAVTKIEVNHRRPIRFSEVFSIKVQAKTSGAKLIFQYLMEKNSKDGQNSEVVAFGQTEHVLVNDEMKPLRIIPELKQVMENQPWNETLLLNL